MRIKNNPYGIVFIEYKYNTSKELVIDVQFEGGSDSYLIKKHKNEIQLSIVNSPD